jgi:hypothetical protein
VSRVEELEREVEAERSRLDASLDALQRRVSGPGLADEVLAQVRRANGRSYATRIRDLARERPLAVALIGLGVGLMMQAGRKPRGSNGSMPS